MVSTRSLPKPSSRSGSRQAHHALQFVSDRSPLFQLVFIPIRIHPTIFTRSNVLTYPRSTAAAPMATACGSSCFRHSPWSSRCTYSPPSPAIFAAIFRLFLTVTRGRSAGGSMPLTPPRPPPQLYPCASTVSLVRSDPPLSYPCDPACFPPKTGFQVSTIAVNLLPGQIISLVGAPPTRIQGLYFMQAVLDEFGSSRRRSSSLPTEAHTRCESSFDRH